LAANAAGHAATPFVDEMAQRPSRLIVRLAD